MITRAVAILNQTENLIGIDVRFSLSKSRTESRFTSAHSHVQLHIWTTRRCDVFSVHLPTGERKETTDTHTEQRLQTEELTLNHINSHINSSKCCKKEALKNSVYYFISKIESNRDLKIESWIQSWIRHIAAALTITLKNESKIVQDIYKYITFLL